MFQNDKQFKQLSKTGTIENLPPTAGAWREHIKRAHWQAHVWEHDLDPHPKYLDPTELGWIKIQDSFFPILSSNPPAPENVTMYVRCSCGTNCNSIDTPKCHARCTCRVNNLECTELCGCCGDSSCINNKDKVLDNDI